MENDIVMTILIHEIFIHYNIVQHHLMIYEQPLEHDKDMKLKHIYGQLPDWKLVEKRSRE